MSFWEQMYFFVVGCKTPPTIDRKRQELCVGDSVVSVKPRALYPSGLGQGKAIAPKLVCFERNHSFEL
jgi:hypothetical protein